MLTRSHIPTQSSCVILCTVFIETVHSGGYLVGFFNRPPAKALVPREPSRRRPMNDAARGRRSRSPETENRAPPPAPRRARSTPPRPPEPEARTKSPAAGWAASHAPPRASTTERPPPTLRVRPPEPEARVGTGDWWSQPAAEHQPPPLRVRPPEPEARARPAEAQHLSPAPTTRAGPGAARGRQWQPTRRVHLRAQQSVVERSNW